MKPVSNTMDIFKLLDKSNCGKCDLPTCLAFAAAVFQGRRQLDECPQLDAATVARYSGRAADPAPLDQEREQALEQLRSQVAAIDLAAAAQRLGARFANGRLTIKCLGKDVSVDAGGQISTDIHVHPWIAVPVLNYILAGAGIPVSGQWVPFRELPGGKNWYRLFGQMCEKPLKRVADTYTDLFADMMQLFAGKQVENHYQSDISLVLHPLPKVPVLICFWKPDEGLASNLNLFFDATAEDNLRIESVYTLAVGLTRMFQKLALRHG